MDYFVTVERVSSGIGNKCPESLGLCASEFWAYAFLSSLLWGVSTTDPWAFAAAAVAILTVGSAACFLPARRAAQVDPLITLRCE